MGNTQTIICLSAPTTLRCADLSKDQSSLLIIPPIIELIVSLFALRAKWGAAERRGAKNKIYWLLFAEAWIFFVLAFIDLISHAAVRNNVSFLHTFEPLDQTIGGLSSIPIILYTIFLFLYVLFNILKSMRKIFRTTAKYILVTLIPVLVLTNELASLLGIQYGLVHNPPVLSVGYTTPSAKNTSGIFSTATLSPLAFYQLLVAIICAWHVNYAERENADMFPQTSGDATISIFCGVGTAFGAAESFIGLASPSYALIFVRRILRLVGRTCIVFGLMRGLVTPRSLGISNFTIVHPNTGFKRPVISAPRTSTFMHIPPFARIPSPTGLNHARTRDGEEEKRVIVVYPDNPQSSAPQLEMRFSSLHIPSPSQIARALSPNSQASARISRTIRTTLATQSSIVFPQRWEERSRSELRSRQWSPRSDSVYSSMDEEPVEHISDQSFNLSKFVFPSPPRMSEGDRNRLLSGSGLPRKLSLRKPPPVASPELLASYAAPTTSGRRMSRPSFPPAKRSSTLIHSLRLVEARGDRTESPGAEAISPNEEVPDEQTTPSTGFDGFGSASTGVTAFGRRSESTGLTSLSQSAGYSRRGRSNSFGFMRTFRPEFGREEDTWTPSEHSFVDGGEESDVGSVRILNSWRLSRQPRTTLKGASDVWNEKV